MAAILAIDRSASRGSWALARDGATVAGGDFVEDLPRSPAWFPAVLAGLAANGLETRDVSPFLAGTGPGSFSGIRAVIAALQGLALPFGARVAGLPSCAALAFAESTRTGQTRIAVVGDARRGKLWLARYDFATAGAAEIAAAPILIDAEALAATLDPGFRIVSPEGTRLVQRLAGLATAHDLSALAADVLPTAGDLLALHAAYPDAATDNPLPAYLHPAV